MKTMILVALLGQLDIAGSQRLATPVESANNAARTRAETEFLNEAAKNQQAQSELIEQERKLRALCLETAQKIQEISTRLITADPTSKQTEIDLAVLQALKQTMTLC